MNTKSKILLNALIMVLCVEVVLANYPSGYNKCKEITIINPTGVSQIDFPMNINISYDADMQSDFDDLRFYLGSCNDITTSLFAELENMSSSNNAYVWIKTNLTSTNTIISMYYGNSSVSSAWNNDGSVWDDNFTGVWLLSDLHDSSRFSRNATNGGAESVSGLFGNAFHFTAGQGDMINISDVNNLLNTSIAITVEVFVKLDSALTEDNFLISQPNNTGSYAMSGIILKARNTAPYNWRFDRYNTTGTAKTILSTSNITDKIGVWTLVTGLTKSNYETRVYVNGVSDSSFIDCTANCDKGSQYEFRIGRGGVSQETNGTIDMVRISNMNRSNSWQNLSFKYYNDSRSFISFGNEIVKPVNYYYCKNNGTDGDDSKDCLSEQNACKTIVDMHTKTLNPGDNVSFCRGGRWNILEENLSSIIDYPGSSLGNITYNAYGTGPKPIFTRSLNYNNTSNWTNIGTNLWETNGTINDDIGLIIFENNAFGEKQTNYSLMDSQDEFYYNSTSDKTTIYSVGNPASIHSTIELSKKGNIFDIQDSVGNILIKDLDLRYSAKTAVFMNNVSNIHFLNNSVWFIGGAIQSGTLRYGNCFETLEDSVNIFVSFNDFHDCFDAAVSNQQDSKPDANFTNIFYTYNIIENSGYCYELFNKNESAITRDNVFDHNTCYNIGQGFGARNYAKSFRTGILRGHASGINITNNIFYDTPVYVYDINDIFNISGLYMNNNLFYDSNLSSNMINWQSTIYTHNQFSTYQSAKNQDLNSIISNPLLNSSFYPASNSPACNMSSTGSYVGALSCANDTCSCPNNPTTAWTIALTDNCILSTSCIAGDLSFTGSGTFNITNGISLNVSRINLTLSNSRFWIGSNVRWFVR